jgi:hypothetical protein
LTNTREIRKQPVGAEIIAATGERMAAATFSGLGGTMRQSCAVIIPVYNERGAIADTVHRMQGICASVSGYEFEIICINDGSSDGTGEILAGLSGVTVITHDVNAATAPRCAPGWITAASSGSSSPMPTAPIRSETCRACWSWRLPAAST